MHNYFSLLTNHFSPVMDTTEILKKIRTLEIKTRGLVETAFAGDYHSVFSDRLERDGAPGHRVYKKIYRGT